MRGIVKGLIAMLVTGILVLCPLQLDAQKYTLTVIGPKKVQAGERFRPPAIVSVKTDREQPASRVSVTAYVSSAGGTLRGVSATSGPDGRAVFDSLSYSGRPAAIEIGFIAGADTTTLPVEVILGEVESVRVLQRPSLRFISDSTFRVQPIARPVDRSGNPLPGIDIEASLTPVTDSHAVSTKKPEGQLLGTTIVRSEENGKAEFRDLSIHGSGGKYLLRFTALGPVEKSSDSIEMEYDPEAESDRSFVVISAIKSIAGQIPKDEFFDLRFRFRLGPHYFFLGSFDLALSARGTDTATSNQETLTEASASVDYGVSQWTRSTTDERERSLFVGAGFRVFNTNPYLGIHVGAIEHTGSPFSGSSMMFGLLHSLNSLTDTLTVVPVDSTRNKNEFASAPWSIGGDFFVRSSTIAFFKVLNLRAGILLPLKPGRKLQSRITIAIPVGTIDVF